MIIIEPKRGKDMNDSSCWGGVRTTGDEYFSTQSPFCPRRRGPAPRAGCGARRPPNPGSSVARERAPAREGIQRGSGATAYMSRTGFSRLMRRRTLHRPPKAPPIEVNPHDEPDAEKFAREKANGGRTRQARRRTARITVNAGCGPCGQAQAGEAADCRIGLQQRP